MDHKSLQSLFSLSSDVGERQEHCSVACLVPKCMLFAPVRKRTVNLEGHWSQDSSYWSEDTCGWFLAWLQLLVWEGRQPSFSLRCVLLLGTEPCDWCVGSSLPGGSVGFWDPLIWGVFICLFTFRNLHTVLHYEILPFATWQKTQMFPDKL